MRHSLIVKNERKRLCDIGIEETKRLESKEVTRRLERQQEAGDRLQEAEDRQQERRERMQMRRLALEERRVALQEAQMRQASHGASVNLWCLGVKYLRNVELNSRKHDQASQSMDSVRLFLLFSLNSILTA